MRKCFYLSHSDNIGVDTVAVLGSPIAGSCALYEITLSVVRLRGRNSRLGHLPGFLWVTAQRTNPAWPHILVILCTWAVMKLKKLQEYNFPTSILVRLEWESPGMGKPEEQTGLAKNNKQTWAFGMKDWGKGKREVGWWGIGRRNLKISIPALYLPWKANLDQCFQPALPQFPICKIRWVILSFHMDAAVPGRTGICRVLWSYVWKKGKVLFIDTALYQSANSCVQHRKPSYTKRGPWLNPHPPSWGQEDPGG